MTRIRRILAWWWATARHAWRPAVAAAAWWPWWCLDHDARDVGRAWTRDIAAAQLAGTTGQELGDLHAARRARMAELATPVEERAAAAAVVALAVSVVATVAGATGWLTVAAVVLLAVVAGAAMATATVAGDDGVAAAVAGTAFVANTAVIVAALFLTAVATVAAVVAAGWWLMAGGQWLAIAVVAIVAVAAGWPAGRLAVAMGLVATVRPQVATEVDDDPATGGRLVAAAVMAAVATKIPAVARALAAGHEARWAERPHHTGHGETGVLELPGGVAADDVAKVAAGVSSAMDVALDRLRLGHAGRGHSAGRLRVTILDAEPATVPWPLADPATPVDLWAVPIGQTLDGRPVTLQLPDRAVVAGGQSSTGKTGAVRQLAADLIAGGAEVHCVWAKGGSDGAPLEGKAASSVTSADDDEAAAAILDGLQLLDATWKRRAVEYRERGWSRITPKIHATEGQHVVALVVDEVAEAMEHPELGPIIGPLAGRVARKGPGFGVMLILATQRPSPVTIPADLLKSCGTRVCFSVADWRDGNAVLGDGKHSRGVAPAELSQADRGLSWLVAEGESVLVQWAEATPEAIVARLAGVVPPAPVAEAVSRGQVLDDVLGCYGPSDDGVQVAFVLESLRLVNPGRYGAMTEQALRDLVAVKTRRFRPEPGGRQVWGWRQIDVVAAFEQEFDVTAPD